MKKMLFALALLLTAHMYGSHNIQSSPQQSLKQLKTRQTKELKKLRATAKIACPLIYPRGRDHSMDSEAQSAYNSYLLRMDAIKKSRKKPLSEQWKILLKKPNAHDLIKQNIEQIRNRLNGICLYCSTHNPNGNPFTTYALTEERNLLTAALHTLDRTAISIPSLSIKVSEKNY